MSPNEVQDVLEHVYGMFLVEPWHIWDNHDVPLRAIGAISYPGANHCSFGQCNACLQSNHSVSPLWCMPKNPPLGNKTPPVLYQKAPRHIPKNPPNLPPPCLHKNKPYSPRQNGPPQNQYAPKTAFLPKKTSWASHVCYPYGNNLVARFRTKKPENGLSQGFFFSATFYNFYVCHSVRLCGGENFPLQLFASFFYAAISPFIAALLHI